MLDVDAPTMLIAASDPTLDETVDEDVLPFPFRAQVCVCVCKCVHVHNCVCVCASVYMCIMDMSSHF